MNILGLNLNPDGFDPSAALVMGGRLVAAGEEERWTGTKHEPSGVPVKSATWCLDSQGLDISDIDVVAYGWDYERFPDGTILSAASDPRLAGWLGSGISSPRITHFYCEHHKAHAYGGWAAGMFQDDTVVVVVDGSGERESSSAWEVNDSGRLQRMWDLPLGNSLGFFYEAACLALGMHRLEGGKVMGLASYGKPIYEIPSIMCAPTQETAPELEQYRGAHAHWRQIIANLKGFEARYNAVDRISQNDRAFKSYADFAASAQRRLEEDLFFIIKRAWESAGRPRNIALSGGVAINCVANGILRSRIKAEMAPEVVLHVQNPPGDAGVAVGAAVAASIELQGRRVEASSSFLGPEPDEDRAVAEARRAGYVVSPLEDASEIILSVLESDEPIGVCSGPMEFGPRALGNRSFVARATTTTAARKLNELKMRELWRPSAPILSFDEAPTLLQDAIASEAMLFSFEATDQMRASYPGAVHVDGTSRAQTYACNPPSEATEHILALAQTYLGDSCLLNTSLNVASPIALGGESALALLADTELRALVVGSSLIFKKG